MATTPNLIQAKSNLPKILVAQSLPSSTAALYTGQAPSGDLDDLGTSTAIGIVTVCNTSGSDRTAYISVTRSGGGTARLANIDLEPGESCVVDELVGFYIGPGDVISGWASAAASVDIAISGAVSS